MWQKMSWVITITASIVAAVLTDATSSPTVIGDHCVPNWAEMKRMIFFLKQKVKSFYTKAVSLKRVLTEIHSWKITVVEYNTKLMILKSKRPGEIVVLACHFLSSLSHSKLPNSSE